MTVENYARLASISIYLSRMPQKKNSHTRLVLAITLCIAAMVASYAMSLAANQKENYWMIARPVSSGTQLEAQDLKFQAVVLGALVTYLRSSIPLDPSLYEIYLLANFWMRKR
jgi:flagella basal body P-ring formation protein FlgA